MELFIQNKYIEFLVLDFSIKRIELSNIEYIAILFDANHLVSVTIYFHYKCFRFFHSKDYYYCYYTCTIFIYIENK